MKCQQCQIRAATRKGLCMSCSVPLTVPTRKPRRLCRHCNERHVNRPLGLCWHCYYTPGVRELYPSESKYSPAAKFHEPTEAELEALIAEGLANKPDWWDEDVEPPEPVEIKVFRRDRHRRRATVFEEEKRA